VAAAPAEDSDSVAAAARTAEAHIDDWQSLERRGLTAL
jgi:hypothetical protein